MAPIPAARCADRVCASEQTDSAKLSGSFVILLWSVCTALMRRAPAIADGERPRFIVRHAVIDTTDRASSEHCSGSAFAPAASARCSTALCVLLRFHATELPAAAPLVRRARASSICGRRQCTAEVLTVRPVRHRAVALIHWQRWHGGCECEAEGSATSASAARGTSARARWCNSRRC